MIFQMQTTIKANDVIKQLSEMLGVDMCNSRNATIHLPMNGMVTVDLEGVQAKRESANAAKETA